MGWLRRGRRKEEVDPVAWASDDAGREDDAALDPAGSARDVFPDPSDDPQGGPGPLLPPDAPHRGPQEAGDAGAGAPGDEVPTSADLFSPPQPPGTSGRPSGRSGSSTSRRSQRSGGESGSAQGSPTAPEPATTSDPPDRTQGPWDASQVDTTEGYIDLGGIRLPARDGMELRLEVEEATGRVTAATVQIGPSAVQLQAFAAPRPRRRNRDGEKSTAQERKRDGIWDEIRAEIAASITRQGGTADEMAGPFGKELLARIPTQTPDGRTTHQPARFAGIDGPRWFLRAVFHGAAAYEAEQATLLEAFVRDVVVVRGADAMAPRELLALRLPDVGGPPEPEDPSEDEGRPPLEPFRRGPEITEVR